MGKIERRPEPKPKGPAPGQTRQGFASSLAREFPDRAVLSSEFRVNSGQINGYGVVEIGQAATVVWLAVWLVVWLIDRSRSITYRIIRIIFTHKSSIDTGIDTGREILVERC
ncbi:hypothetical protein AMR42_07540 [Limnothrix sp. PR1529]|nr:hypothetical protein BCR12_01980 [Limnothrix sp. P13C2]PIB14166.1 hypothetical protein AMR42_07540 [Limnothrix sp. PR1529]